MFCVHCGVKVEESQGYCGSCGERLASGATVQPKRKSRLTRGLLLGLAVIVALLALHSLSAPDRNKAQITSDTQQNTPPHAVSAPTDSGQSQSMDNPPSTYKMDQTFAVGYWSYICHGAYWTSVLGSNPYSVERASAEFVVVDITARNDDTSSSTLPPFQLMDSDGRTYDASSAGMLSQGFFSVLEQLNPGVSKRGSVAFDVPPNRQYSLVLSGGIESDKRALVVLPMSTPPAVLAGPPSDSVSPNAAGPAPQPSYDSLTVDVNSVRDAAEKGDVGQQSKLGMMYRNGRGVYQDYAEAYFWLDVAASEPEWVKAQIAGTADADAEKLRHFNAWHTANTPFFREVEKWQDDAASHLSPEKLVQVQERVRKWHEDHPTTVK